MMESSSVAYHIKRHRKHSKRLMTVCAELINLVQNLEIDSEDWDIIGQRLSLTPSLMLSFTSQDIFALQLLPSYLKCGK